jgi:hypothetical protein
MEATLSPYQMRQHQMELCRALNSSKNEKEFFVLPNRYPEDIFRKANKFGAVAPHCVYLSKQERENLKINFENGLVFKQDKKILDTIEENKLLKDGCDYFLIVMDRTGNIYAAPRKVKSFLEKTLENKKEAFVCHGKLTINNLEVYCVWVEIEESVFEYEVETEKVLNVTKSFFYEKYNPIEIQKYNRDDYLIRKGTLKQQTFRLANASSEIKHSSMVAGEPAAFAGELICIEGKIVCISDRSGHYQPPKEFTKIFIEHLKKMKVNLDNCKIDFTLNQNEKLTNDFLKKINFIHK